MNNLVIVQLAEYYHNQGIHPEKFVCSNQLFCRRFAHEGKMTEAKMSLVGSRYGEIYPRIVVLSCGFRWITLPGIRVRYASDGLFT